MAYKALYRQYRPMKFEDVFGQETIIKTLKNSIKNNKISHAYLFSGPRGIGKTSIARIFAKALNCKNVVSEEPCLECKTCTEIANGTSVDVIEIDAASNNGVDEIRDIREKVKFLPVGAKYKIYIIDEVHMLSQGAFNALLKTLEEPPHHAIFILATTELHKIPATIISRCQCFEFKALTISQISSNIKSICEKENINITDSAVNAISVYSEGGMRDALSVLDQAISFSSDVIDIDVINEITGSLNYDIILEVIKSLEVRDINNAMIKVEDLLNNGKDSIKIINTMLDIYKDILIYRNIGKYNEKAIYENETFIELANNINDNNIYYYVDILTDVSQKIKLVSNPQVILEVSLVRITNASLDALRLAKKIEELEQRIDEINVPSNPVSSTNVSVSDVIVEEKLNKVITQLNKMNLPEVITRVNALEEKVNSIKENNNSSELASIQEDIFLLKTKSTTSDGVSEDVLNDAFSRIDELEKQVSNKANKDEIVKVESNSNYKEVIDKITSIEQIINTPKQENEVLDISEIKDDLKVYIDSKVENYNISSQIAMLEEKIEKMGANLNQETMQLLEKKIEEIDSIKRNLQNNKYSHSSDYDLNEIKNKIVNIENKLHKYIAIINQDEVNVVKKSKSVKSNVAYYGEGLFSVDEFNNTKINAEFDGLEKDPTEIVEVKVEPKVDVKVNEVINEVVSKKEPLIEETVEEIVEAPKAVEEVIEVKEEVKETPIVIEEVPVKVSSEPVKKTSGYDQISLFDVLDKLASEPQVNEKEEISTDYSDEFDKKLKEVETTTQTLEMEKSNFDIEKPKTLEELKEELNIDEKVDERQKEIDLFNSLSNQTPKNEIISKVETNEGTLITKTNSQLYRKNQDVSIYDVFSQSKVEVDKKIKEVTETIVSPKPKNEFETYDVTVIERILNESRSEEAKNDKTRVLKIWNILDKNIDYSQVDIAEMLKMGEVKAVGKKEFIITYPTTLKCSQVMKPKFKNQAKKFLYDKLGDSYNYMALPEEVWNMKRQEYATQYYTGSKYPKLTPISESILRELTDNDDYKDDSDKAIDKIQQMFGSDIVKVE